MDRTSRIDAPALACCFAMHVLAQRRRVIVTDHHGDVVAKFYQTTSLARAAANARLFVDALKSVELFEATGGKQLQESQHEQNNRH